FYLFFQGALFFQAAFFALIYYATRRKDVFWFSLYLFAAAAYFFINATGTFFRLDENQVFESAWYNWINIPVIIVENLFYLLFIKAFFVDIVSRKLRMVFQIAFFSIPILFIIFLFLRLSHTGTQSIFYTVKLLSVIPALLIVITVLKDKLP